jgi:hypothetical protein
MMQRMSIMVMAKRGTVMKQMEEMMRNLWQAQSSRRVRLKIRYWKGTCVPAGFVCERHDVNVSNAFVFVRANLCKVCLFVNHLQPRICC